MQGISRRPQVAQAHKSFTNSIAVGSNAWSSKTEKAHSFSFLPMAQRHHDCRINKQTWALSSHDSALIYHKCFLTDCHAKDSNKAAISTLADKSSNNWAIGQSTTLAKCSYNVCHIFMNITQEAFWWLKTWPRNGISILMQTNGA